MSRFNADEWRRIRETLNADPQRYGLPQRVYGSAVLATFNIRKLGAKSKRDARTWRFLADILGYFDLVAVQEVLEDMQGLRHLEELMGENFGMVVSDTTGSFPNEGGVAERLAFIFNWTIVHRQEMVTDVTFDRSKVLQVIAEQGDAIQDAVEAARHNREYRKKLKAYEKKLAKFEAGEGREPHMPALPIQMPAFLTFIRTPFAVMFEILGHPGAERYSFMAVNAHLYFGNFIDDRRQEFDALMSWIMGRVQECDEHSPLNILLLGDLNLDFDNPINDRGRIISLIDELNRKGGKAVNVYFPFLHPHPQRPGQQMMGRDGRVLQSNARLSETFDQIGFFSRDERLKLLRNAIAGEAERGPDFGVFDFVNLFSEALHGKPFEALQEAQRKALVSRFEHNVSDHMPLWFRIPLPDVEPGISPQA
jgi:endonuclease/exonuclease/phosphatase family metal-dependent hydrolase